MKFKPIKVSVLFETGSKGKYLSKQSKDEITQCCNLKLIFYLMATRELIKNIKCEFNGISNNRNVFLKITLFSAAPNIEAFFIHKVADF